MPIQTKYPIFPPVARIVSVLGIIMAVLAFCYFGILQAEGKDQVVMWVIAGLMIFPVAFALIAMVLMTVKIKIDDDKVDVNAGMFINITVRYDTIKEVWKRPNPAFGGYRHGQTIRNKSYSAVATYALPSIKVITKNSDSEYLIPLNEELEQKLQSLGLL